MVEIGTLMAVAKTEGMQENYGLIVRVAQAAYPNLTSDKKELGIGFVLDFARNYGPIVAGCDKKNLSEGDYLKAFAKFVKDNGIQAVAEIINPEIKAGDGKGHGLEFHL